MVCPYCSADMEPIDLNGKVFCSNCGLTVANNAPAISQTNTINPEPTAVEGVTTETPEEVPFPVMPDVAETEATNEPVVPESTDMVLETESVPRKLEVVTEDTPPTVNNEVMNPITEEAVSDLGLVQPAEEPVFESKISDLSIPSEEDFSMSTPEDNVTTGSYVELENTGDERTNLEASGILLDILGEETGTSRHSEPSEESRTPGPGSFVPTQDDKILNPVVEPEIPEKTITKEDDDIYTLPTEVRVGLRNKKIKKEIKNKDLPPETFYDTKTEKKIEKLEEKINEIPEPVVKLSPEEAEEYDPDTIDVADIDVDNHKGEVIKEYFSAAIEKDKKAKKTKQKKANKKNKLKVFALIFAGLGALAALAIGGYITYYYFQPSTQINQGQETTNFDTQMPGEVVPGYVLSDSKFSNEEQAFRIVYRFASDDTKTITYNQVKTSDSSKFISDYLLTNNSAFTEKTVNGVVYTESNKANILWSVGDFVFVIETTNYDLTNELLYKMAESVK